MDFAAGVIYELVRMGKKPPTLLDNKRAIGWGLTHELWRIMSLSWKKHPSDRPDVGALTAWLQSPNLVYSVPGRSDPDSSIEQSSAAQRSGESSKKYLRKPLKGALHGPTSSSDSYSYEVSVLFKCYSNDIQRLLASIVTVKGADRS